MGKRNKIKVYDENNLSNYIILFIIDILVYACTLMITQYLFKGIYIESFFQAIIAAIILSLLNFFVKPFLIYLTLPLTIMTFGIAYPIVNVIILKLCDIIMGNSFNLGGFITTFVIAVFISFLKMLLDNLVTNKLRR